MQPQTLYEMLLRLAGNYRWTWAPACEDLLRSLPGARISIHPVETVRSLSDGQLATLATDDDLVARARREIEALETQGRLDVPAIAYFSAEFGISHHALQYAGGLGVLAGDHLKASSDTGLPLVGVGLFYHLGAFHQEIRDGVQVERLARVEPEKIAAVDTGVVVEVPFPGREVKAKVHRVEVGRVELLLLDTHDESNPTEDRAITDSLYLGSAQQRTAQEMILGVGGVRALRAMGWDPAVHHLNEGHAGFATLELLDRVITNGDIDAAVQVVRQHVVFTTHTPVPAGITRLRRDILMPYLEIWSTRWGVDPERLWALGSDPDNGDEFNMPMFCLRLSRTANGVSRLHGEVSRGLFASLPEGKAITHVTNGVHARSWTARSIQDLFDDALGAGWDAGEVEAWEPATAIDDETIGSVRREGSDRLSRRVKDFGISLDPDALIIGFARRFAPYKRATLVLAERARLAELLGDDDRPIHFLFAGKAHPANEAGRSILGDVVGFSNSAESMGRFSFVPDYDMEIGGLLVQGVDIWLNNPVRLEEASGTSGEKAALNGALNLSVLDGWWAEMYDGENGWAIPSSHAEEPGQRDAEDAAGLMDVLISAHNEHYDARGRFNNRIRHAWRTLGPRVTAARMLDDYRRQIYRI